MRDLEVADHRVRQRSDPPYILDARRRRRSVRGWFHDESLSRPTLVPPPEGSSCELEADRSFRHVGDDQTNVDLLAERELASFAARADGGVGELDDPAALVVLHDDGFE